VTAVRVHRIGEVDLERRLAARALSTAAYYRAHGDRANAAHMLVGAATCRRLLIDAKRAHAECCPSDVQPRTPRLPGWAQLTWAPHTLRPGRWLP
jgi:hypothetical protein